MIHDSLDLAKPEHLDKRLISVQNIASLPVVSSQYLYEGALIYVKDEGTDYQIIRKGGNLKWAPIRQQFLRTSLIW